MKLPKAVRISVQSWFSFPYSYATPAFSTPAFSVAPFPAAVTH